MGAKSNLEFTYLGNLRNACYSKNCTDEEELQGLLATFKKFAYLPPQFMPMIFAADYTQRKYIFYSDSMKNNMGYDVQEILENGFDMVLNITNQDYFKTINEKVFPANMQFLQSVAQSDHQNYVFSFNNRYRKADGQWAEYLQKGSFITSKTTGMPLCSIGLLFDITSFKKDNAIVQSIEKHNPGLGYEVIETNYFYPYEEDTLLTNQEKNIVKYMADGLSSKMIAGKLKLSENTVANHRKNMLRKANAKNVAQLIAFVSKNHII